MGHYFVPGFSVCQEGRLSQLGSGAGLCVGCDPKQIHLVSVILSEPAPQVLPVGYLGFIYPRVGRTLTLVRLGSLCFPLTEHLFCYVLFASGL